jgi:1,4-dihydroxy-2-naphthoate polyprenyltransferase
MAKNFNFGLWLEASRPKTWLASITPVLAGILDGARYPLWDGWKALGCVAVALFLQIAANFFNDADDAERGADSVGRNGPRRLVATGLISKAAIRAAGVWLVMAVAGIALAVVPFDMMPIWIMGALAVIAAVTYTGAGVAYGYKGLGELVCFIFFGPVAVIGTEIVVSRMISLEGILLGIGAGALSVAILEVNNIRDADTDKAAGKMTLAARFGRKVGYSIFMGAVMTALVVDGILAAKYFWVWGSAAITLIIGARIYATLTQHPKPAVYNKLLAVTAVMLFFWGLCTAAGILIGPIHEDWNPSQTPPAFSVPAVTQSE